MKNILENLSIEHKGYKLSPTENLMARFGRFAILHDGIKEGKAFNLLDDSKNKFVQNFADKAYERKQRRGTNQENEPLSTKNMLLAATYEIGTLAVPRQMGMMAVRAAARFGLKYLKSSEGRTARTLAAVHDFTDSRLEEAEHGLHNPVLRDQSGYNLRELRERRAQQRDSDLGNNDTYDPFAS